MKKISGIATTEKGALKNAVREGIVAKVNNLIATDLSNKGFEAFPDNKAMALVYEDKMGTKVYATLTLTVSLLAPNEKAKRSKTKKSSVENIEIGD